jgi:hypothetical protein
MMDLFVWLEGSSLSVWVREAPTIWAFATIITLHTFGMGVLVGACAVLDLRILGVANAIPLGPLRTLYKVMWAGFWLNLVTGTLLFCADATSRGTQWLFFVKMFFVIAGVITTIQINKHLYGGNAEPIEANATVKRLALVSLAAWVLATTSGRLLAYVQ